MDHVRAPIEQAPWRHDPLGFWTCAILGAALSLMLTGFVFATSNNLFHLPIFAALYDEPQFADDAFVQSLRYFSSGLWLMLSGADRYLDPYWTFASLHALSRLIAFAALLAWLGLLGMTSRPERGLFTLLLCFTSLLRGESFAGGGELFDYYFSHSELATALSLAVVYFACNARFAAALATNGAVFFLNSFIGFWNLIPILLLGAGAIARGVLPWQTAVRQASIGGAAFIVFAAPVLVNALSNPDFGRELNFNYVAYLRSYWPEHFLFGEVAVKEQVALVVVLAIALTAFAALGPRADRFRIALYGYLVLYAVGIILPHLTQHPVALNLHLLRASALFHFLAAFAGLALATRWATGGDPVQKRILMPALVVTLATTKYLLLAAPIIILASLWKPKREAATARWSYAVAPLAAVIVVSFGAYSWWDRLEWQRDIEAWNREWTLLGEWARSSTPVDARFLLPVKDFRDPARMKNGIGEHVMFEYAARRRVWIDYKRGAAVMWAPSFNDIWWTRVNDLAGLTQPSARMAYAAKTSLDYVVELCAEAEASLDALQPVFRSERLCVYDVSRAASSIAVR